MIDIQYLKMEYYVSIHLKRDKINLADSTLISSINQRLKKLNQIKVHF